MPWNSKGVRNRASSVQPVSEIKSPISKVTQPVVQPAKEKIIVEKQQNEVSPMKNNTLDLSSSSNVSSQVISTPVIHSAEHSFGKHNIN